MNLSLQDAGEACPGVSGNICDGVIPAGADSEFEEGWGTHRVGLVQPCGGRSAHIFFCVLITHSVLEGSGGMLLQEFMRVLLTLSETTITKQNLWQLDCDSGNRSFFRAPSLQNQPLYMRHCHRTVSWELQI